MLNVSDMCGDCFAQKIGEIAAARDLIDEMRRKGLEPSVISSRQYF